MKSSYLQVGIHEVHNNRDTWNVSKDINKLDNILMLHLEGYSIEEKDRSNLFHLLQKLDFPQGSAIDSIFCLCPKYQTSCMYLR